MFAVGEDGEGRRLDRWLAEQLPRHSRSRLAGWIREGRVSLGDRLGRPSDRLTVGQRVRVEPPPPPAKAPPAQDVPFEVLYADDALVVVDKPAGLVVHPGAGHPDGTLVNGLLHRVGSLSPIGAPERPGIVHRIDAGTSGVLVAARTEAAHTALARQFAAHSAERVYRALVWDHGLADEGVFETAYGRHPGDRRRFTGRTERGKRALTRWTVRRRLGPCAWVDVRLETGRTHQIRVHFSEAGHPLVGDPMYGRRRRIERPARLRHLGFELGLTRQALHAAVLGFEHPDGGHLRFEAPLPADLDRIAAVLVGEFG